MSASIEMSQGRNAFGALALFMVVIWFGCVAMLGQSGFFARPSPIFLSWLQLSIITPMIAFWLAYLGVPAFRRFIHGLDLIFLTAIQCTRVLGLAIMVMWGYGLLPGQFAIAMSNLDASVGVIAVYVVWMIARNMPGWRLWAVSVHSWGFFDFLVTIALALFAMKALPIDPTPSPGGYALLTQMPLSMFPSIAIPFYSCVHFAALIQLLRMRPTPDRT